MTKKDYQAIAGAIYRESKALSLDTRAAEACRILTRSIANVMAADNPRFDRTRFVEACETGKYRKGVV